MARKGNPANLRPRTLDGLKTALADVAGTAGLHAMEAAAACRFIRDGLKNRGWLAKVTIAAGVATATSGALSAEARLG